MIVYQALNTVTGEIYVGQTKYTLDQRANEHRTAAARGYPQDIYIAIRKYGFDVFEWSILEECDTPEELNEAEKMWITKLDTHLGAGYNMAPGGNGFTGPIFRTDEAKARAREANTGELNPFYGGTHSAEARDKIAKAARERWKDPEYRKKMTKINRDRAQTSEHKARAAALGKSTAGKPSWSKGKKFSPEHREKIRQAALKREAEKRKRQ